MEANRIYHGDNLYYLPDMPAESLDLIYIDPPFGTQSLWQSRAFKEKVQDFKFYDIWGRGPHGYINFMTERLRHMHRLLKPTGSLFVHLDWRMSHYIKIELDKIFGVKNPAAASSKFINELVWCYTGPSNSKRYFAKKHDVILWYAKTKGYYFDFDSTRVPYKKLRTGKTSGIFKKAAVLNERGKGVEDWWADITPVGRLKNELTGWPTQKPLALLRRIIQAASKPGDLVADFFCGCGTSIAAAEDLGRKWIGIDASMTACKVMLKRIRERMPLFNHGIIKRHLAGKDFKRLSPLEFEKAAVRCIGGVTNHAQTGDAGIDGRLAFDGAPIQVKKSEKAIGDTDAFRAFYVHLRQHGRGVFISYSGFSNGAKERAIMWRKEGLDIQLLTVRDILAGRFRERRRIDSGGKKPVSEKSGLCAKRGRA